jgi:hypothetical protein
MALPGPLVIVSTRHHEPLVVHHYWAYWTRDLRASYSQTLTLDSLRPSSDSLAPLLRNVAA